MKNIFIINGRRGCGISGGSTDPINGKDKFKDHKHYRVHYYELDQRVSVLAKAHFFSVAVLHRAHNFFSCEVTKCEWSMLNSEFLQLTL